MSTSELDKDPYHFISLAWNALQEVKSVMDEQYRAEVTEICIKLDAMLVSMEGDITRDVPLFIVTQYTAAKGGKDGS